MKYVLPLGLLVNATAVGFCFSSSALACGALPEAMFTFAASLPADGALDVPRNHPIVLGLNCSASPEWSPIVADAACSHRPSDLEVELRGRDGAVVPGRVAHFGEELVFLPSSVLAAETEYELTASVPSRNSMAGDGRRLSASFRTGTAMLPTLTDGAPRADVSMEWYDAPAVKCTEGRFLGDQARGLLGPFICPGPYTSCMADGSGAVTRLRVKLGPFAGGLASRGYGVELLVTDHTAGDFDRSAYAVTPEENRQQPHQIALYTTVLVHESEPAELLLDLPEPRDRKTPICIRVRASDAAAEVVSEQSVCTPYEALVAQLGAAVAPTSHSDASVPPASPASNNAESASDGGAALSSASSDSEPTSGCSASPHSPLTQSYAWLATAMLALRSSRRLPRRAPRK